MNAIMVSGDRFTRSVKIWFAESATYNFTVNISMGLVYALLIKMYSYGIHELGVLTIARLLAYASSQLPAAWLVEEHRHLRKKIWLYMGIVNRVGWALVILALFMPREYVLPYVAVLSFIAQFAGGVAGVAAMDVLGDLVPFKESTTVFSRANQLAYSSILVAHGLSIVLFALPIEIALKYTTAYLIALVVAIASSILLYFIPDPGRSLQSINTTSPSGMSEIDKALKNIIHDQGLRGYLFLITFFNFAVNIPAPFWDYIVMNTTGGNELFVVLKNFAGLSSKIFGTRMWSTLMRRRGVRRAMIAGIASSSLIPVAYSYIAMPFEIIGVEAYSGFVWASIDISSNIYNIYLSPSTLRPLYLSMLGFTTNTVAGLASTLGSIIAVSTGNITPVLILSGTMRGLSALLAYKVLPEPGETPVKAASITK